MKFTPVDMDVLREKRIYRRTKNLQIIEDFITSGYVCARLDDTDYKTAYSGCNAIKKSISLYHYTDTVGVMARNGEIYLYLKDMFEQEGESDDLETE